MQQFLNIFFAISDDFEEVLTIFSHSWKMSIFDFFQFIKVKQDTADIFMNMQKPNLSYKRRFLMIFLHNLEYYTVDTMNNLIFKEWDMECLTKVEQREWICNLINVFQVPSDTGMAKPCNFSNTFR